MKIVFKHHMTFSFIADAKYPVDFLPSNGDVIFFRDKNGEDLSAVCEGRIFDFRKGSKASILIDNPKPA